MADYNLFGNLRRLFSSNVIVRNVGGKKLKVADTNNIQATISNATRDRFNRLHVSSGYGSPSSQYGPNMAYQAQRNMLFRDYDLMDNDPIISSALDIYADESTVKNEYGEILTVTADSIEVKEVLHNLFYDILNVEFNLWWWTRNLCKYGDFFLFLEISPEYGIHNVLPLSVYDTIRVEGENPENPYYVYFETMGATGHKQKFDNYEIAHFRMIGDGNFLPYGKAMVENGRRVFRQLTMMEDAMMIHRIMRAPAKRIFNIDVGNIPPADIDGFMEKIITRSKKIPFIDPTTGDYNLRYNMQNLQEDFYFPSRGKNSQSTVTNLDGLEYNAIEDIEYLRNKLMAALKIPKAFLGYEEEVNGKATLAAEDVRYSHTIERIQKVIVSELTKIAVVHLYAQGYRDEDLINFKLSLTNPSTIAEQEKLNIWKQKAELVAQLDGIKKLPSDWVYEKVFEMTANEANKMRAQLVKDAKFQFRLTQIEQGQSDPAKFGYPQDEEPQDDVVGGNPNSIEGTQEAQITSVDQLPTAAELGLEEGEETRGRTKTGSQYGQDSHVRGRDPLGLKQQYQDNTLSAKRAPSKKSPLSLEVANALERMTIQKTIPKLLKTESLDNSDKGTYLDEANIIEK